MDPDCKRRISRSLGSLDDILVTLERLKQGPGFSHADQEVKVAKEPDATCSPRGQEGQEESREPEVSAERSKSREEEEEEGGEGGGGSRGDAIEEQSPLPSGEKKTKREFRFYRSPIDSTRNIDLARMSSAAASRHDKAPSLASMPPLTSPGPSDVFVEMLNQDWDVYRHGLTGRSYYHNCVEGISQWKPPRKTKNSPAAVSAAATAAARIPRSTNSIFTFNSRKSALAEDGEDGEDGGYVLEEEEATAAAADRERRVAVRESIRRDDQPRVVPPIGYLEEADSSSGHICYREAFSDDVIWFTSLDSDGRLYFYTKDGRAEWSLPELRPDADEVDGRRASRQRRQKKKKKPGPIEQLSVLVSGLLSRKLLSGQLPGSWPGSGSGSGSKHASAKKWAVRYGVVTENTLLFFPDELSFRRMHLCDDAAARESLPPDLCVDLSQCTLRWISKASASGKRKNVVEIKSSLLGIELNLHFDQHSDAADDYGYSEALRWFDAISRCVRGIEQEKQSEKRNKKWHEPHPHPPVTSPMSPMSPMSPASPAAAAVSPLRLNLDEQDLPDSPSNPRALLSPHFSVAGAAAAAEGYRRQKHPSGVSIRTLHSEGSLVISPPTNFVKASAEELRQQLLRNARSNPDLTFLAAGAGGDPCCFDDDSAKGSPNPIGEKQLYAKGARKLNRNGGLSRSFRKMADAVHLRPKGAKVERVHSQRSKFLSKFFDNQGSSAHRRQSRDELQNRGILKNPTVFGNDLALMPRDEESGLPEFMVRCIARLENMLDSDGLYRVNGDVAVVQKLRLEVDNDNFTKLEGTTDATLLASALKLFLRELPDPLISATLRDDIQRVLANKSAEPEDSIRESIEERKKKGSSGEKYGLVVLAHLMRHLCHVATFHKKNRMNASNLATVFAPNLVHSTMERRRPESVMSEIEFNNIIVEKLIESARSIFP